MIDVRKKLTLNTQAALITLVIIALMFGLYFMAMYSPVLMGDIMLGITGMAFIAVLFTIIRSALKEFC